MNHVPLQTVFSDPPRALVGRVDESYERAQVAVDEALLVAYEQGDVAKVRKLHAVASLLAACKH